MARNNEVASKFWWVLTVRGVAAILFGIAAVFWPGITLVTLVYLFSAFILVSGVVSLVRGVASAKDGGLSWLLTLVIGLVELGVGVYLVRHPLVSFATLILLVGFVLIIRGVIEGVGVLLDEQAGATEKTLVLIAGIVTALAGIILLFQPASAGVAFVWILGLYALITGPILIALSADAREA